MNTTRDIEAVLREQVIPAGASRHGIVVGVERYKDTRLNLRCARADAQAIYDLMVDSECGMFPRDNVKLLLDEDATYENVWRSLTQLRKAVVPSDMVWIFFAGHAAFEGSRFFWVTHDADVDDLLGTAIDKERFDSVLHDVHAGRVLVMLDCCHAAANAVQKNPTRVVLTAEQLLESYKGEGRITLASSDGKEKSIELVEYGHGAFSYFLKQGLRGEADADADGVVTANELWDYLRNKVTEASIKAGNRQTPVWRGEMKHNLALTLNPMVSQQKRKLEEVLREHVGWDEKNELSTEEGAWCRKLIHDGPRTDDEWTVYRELERLVDGHALIGTIKKLVKMARGATTTKGKDSAPVSRICPSCGKYLKVPASCAGRDIPCPSCKILLHVATDRSALAIVEVAPEKQHNFASDPSEADADDVSARVKEAKPEFAEKPAHNPERAAKTTLNGGPTATTYREELIIPPKDWDISEEDEDTSDSSDPGAGIIGHVVHEHLITGFYADVFIPEHVTQAKGLLAVTLSHQLLGRKPAKIDIRLPDSTDPIQYVRLANLIHGYPATLRLYWLARTKGCYSFAQSRSTGGLKPFDVKFSPQMTTSCDEIGYLTNNGKKFRSVIPNESVLPLIVKETRTTAKDYQTTLALSVAVREREGEVARSLWKMTVPVLPLPAGKASVLFVFRLDPDGRFTLVARNPFRQGEVLDVFVAGLTLPV